MSPFEALYGYFPPLLLPYFAGDSKNAAVDQMLQEREHLNQLLKLRLKEAQNRMQQKANKHRSERTFAIGDQVLLKLQPYHQTSMHQGKPKLQPRFYGPFPVIDKINSVAYKLQLPPEAQIHNVFHVSQLKPFTSSIPRTPLLPSIQIKQLQPQAILERRMVKRKNMASTQWLIHWGGLSPAEATWEWADEIQARFPQFLEDKES